MELALEVAFAVLAVFAVISSEVVEMLLSPVLIKYNIDDKDLRTGIFIAGATVINFILLYWQDVDVIANLLEQNSYWATIGLSAFAATGLGEYYHKFKGLIGKKEGGLIEIFQDTLDAAKDDTPA
jgi:hypothetical protein